MGNSGLGDSDVVEPGLPVAVTGYPLPNIMISALGTSLQSCTTSGIVSALRQNAVPGVAQSRPLIQYDAGTTHGNSGGPVYRLDTGEVIGVATLAVAETDFLNLAVPSNEVKLLLQRVGLFPSTNLVDAYSPDAYVPPGDLSALNVVGPDKSLASQLVTSQPVRLRPQSWGDASTQIASNAGYFSCFGRLAPPLSQPCLVDDRLFMTGNDGRLRVFDPSRATTADPLRELFNVESRFMFFPAVGTEEQVLFSAGTPQFSAEARTDETMMILSILSVASGGPAYSTAKVEPSIATVGSILSVNPRNGTLNWEYDSGFAGPPLMVGENVFFGGISVYGSLDAGTGDEHWVHRGRLGRDWAKWYVVRPLGDRVYVLRVPIKAHFSEQFPGFVVLGDGPLALLAVAASDGHVIWETDVAGIEGAQSPLAAGLAVDGSGKRVYVVRDSRVLAYSPDGKQLWAEDYGPQDKSAEEGRRMSAERVLTRFSPEIAHDRHSLYLGGNDGQLYCISAATGAVRWTFTGLRPMLTPSLHGDELYCGTEDGWMHVVDPADGSLLWKVRIDSPAVGSPVVLNGLLYFASQGLSGLEGSLNSVYMPKTLAGR